MRFLLLLTLVVALVVAADPDPAATEPKIPEKPEGSDSLQKFETVRDKIKTAADRDNESANPGAVKTDDDGNVDVRDSEDVTKGLDDLQARMDKHQADLEQLAVGSAAVKAIAIRKHAKNLKGDVKAGLDSIREEHKELKDYPIKSPQIQHLLQRAKNTEDDALRTIKSIKLINSGGKMPFELPPRDDDAQIIPNFREPHDFDPRDAAMKGEKRAMKILDSEDRPEDLAEKLDLDQFPDAETLNPKYADPEKEEQEAAQKAAKQPKKEKKSSGGSALIQQEDSIDSSVERALKESARFLPRRR